jgi:hypothetical protein
MLVAHYSVWDTMGLAEQKDSYLLVSATSGTEQREQVTAQVEHMLAVLIEV